MFGLRPLPRLPFPSSGFPLKQRAEFAVETVYQACHIAQVIQDHPPVWCGKKPDGSLVTAADLVIQVHIAKQLERFFPNDPLLSEESSKIFDELPVAKRDRRRVQRMVRDWVDRFIPRVRRSEFRNWIDFGAVEHRTYARYWGSDPIDVTTGFITRQPYAINLFLIEEGVVQIGVMGCPNLSLSCSPDSNIGELLVAVRGYGAWCCGLSQDDQFHKLEVSNRRSLENGIMIRSLQDTSSRFTETDRTLASRFLASFGEERKVIRACSPLRYALLAAGLGDFFCNIPLACYGAPFFTHDHAAGALLVMEAGGVVTDLWGQELDLGRGRCMTKNFGVAASSHQNLHGQVLKKFDGVTSQLYTREQKRAMVNKRQLFL